VAAAIADTEGDFIWEWSVDRILKAVDLITGRAFILVKAADQVKHSTKRVNELWPTDFSQINVVSWDYYYLSTVLDDFSRYMLAWTLTPALNHRAVEQTLEPAATGVKPVAVKHPPDRSDNIPPFIAGIWQII
jgi:transposase InsO family protein